MSDSGEQEESLVPRTTSISDEPDTDLQADTAEEVGFLLQSKSNKQERHD